MTDRKPMRNSYSTTLKWFLSTPGGNCIPSKRKDMLTKIGYSLDPLSKNPNHATQIGLEFDARHPQKVDVSIRGSDELFDIEGIAYPRWLSDWPHFIDRHTNDSSLLKLYYLEFDDCDSYLSLSGLFQACNFEDNDHGEIARLIHEYHLKRGLEARPQTHKGRAFLLDLLANIGTPLQIGMLNRNANFVKFIVNLEPSCIDGLEQCLRNSYFKVIHEANLSIDCVIACIKELLKTRNIMLSLDYDWYNDEPLPRFSFEIPFMRPTIRQECIKTKDLILQAKRELAIIQDGNLALQAWITSLPFAERLAEASETNSINYIVFHNHSKISIERGQKYLKEYIGIRAIHT